MQRICIVALVGLPAVGKTSFSHWLLQLSQLPFNVVHICYDDYLKLADFSNLTATNSTSTFKLQRMEILKLLQLIVNSIRATGVPPADFPQQVKISYSKLHASSKDFLIICDDNNYYRSMRHQLYQYCRDQQFGFAQIYFDCDFKIALQRNALRAANDVVPADVMQRMRDRLEIPLLQASSWEFARTLMLNTTNDLFEFFVNIILQFLLSAFTKIPEKLEETSETTQSMTNSTVHDLDLLLRERIKQLLTVETSCKKERAQSLNEKRKEILQHFKEQQQQEFLGEIAKNDLSELVKLLK